MQRLKGKKTITTIAITATIITGYFAIDSKIQKEPEINSSTLIEKSENGELTYDEYIELVKQYNGLVKEKKIDNEPFILENISQENTVIEELNKKLK